MTKDFSALEDIKIQIIESLENKRPMEASCLLGKTATELCILYPLIAQKLNINLRTKNCKNLKSLQNHWYKYRRKMSIYMRSPAPSTPFNQSIQSPFYQHYAEPSYGRRSTLVALQPSRMAFKDGAVGWNEVVSTCQDAWERGGSPFHRR
mmetsp:Transcript_27825/g.42386  ORF Transcript_27825/g.42386 Transcript_27825/m.42386 type:complete len:150 (-) Transcript_27825:50-499(-)